MVDDILVKMEMSEKNDFLPYSFYNDILPFQITLIRN